MKGEKCGKDITHITTSRFSYDGSDYDDTIRIEEDEHYRGWSDANYGEGKWCFNKEKVKYVRFHIKVNTRNSKRFFPLADFNNPIALQHSHIEDSAKISLRRQKALYLYNKIRAYRMQSWWD